MRLRHRSFHLSTIAGCVAFTLAQVSAADAQQAVERAALSSMGKLIDYDIPAQSLESALSQFAIQSKRQLIFDPHTVPAIEAPAIKGAFAPEEVLGHLLRNSGLAFRVARGNTIVVTAEGTSAIASRAGAFRVAQASVSEASDDAKVAASKAQNSSEIAEPKKQSVEEIVVTGSHIRGIQNSSSPVISFDRKDIEASGYATTQQFIQSLPQNLNTVSDTTLGNINGGSGTYDTYDGSAINLRGLGGDATLVLVNGRRVAAAGNGSFVDLSLIPLSAVERIDVLTDGASAIYGSDAVGGVVNIVLRNDFEGAETRLRYGSVIDGNHDEQQAGQMLGHAWNSGHALVSYEYFRRTELDGGDRDFFDPSTTFASIDLIPEQSRHGAFAMLRQRLSAGVELSSDVFYGQRGSVYTYSIGVPYDNASDVRHYGASLGLNVDLIQDWQLRLTGLFDQNDSELQLIDGATGAQLAYYGNESRLWSMDVAADGSLMSVRGGDVRLAVGGHVRREEFVDENPLNPGKLDRDIGAIYAEALIPWVGVSNRRKGVDRLELTLAARYEDYSDFGSTFNPKVGIAWAPAQGLNVRGTWGTSFKAPLLTQLNPGNRSSTIYVGRYQDVSGPTTVLSLSGNGESLGPEKSKNWTAGLDFTPEGLPELTLAATYFEIEYDDRISSPYPSGYDLGSVLLDPTYDVIVSRNPGASHVDAAIADAPNVYCYTYETGFPLLCDASGYSGHVRAIIDGRQRNLAGVHMAGVDFSLKYRLESDFGAWGLTVAGSHLLKNQERLVPGAFETSELNNVYRPVDFRMRAGLTFSRNAFNASAFVNYTDNYRDVGTRSTGAAIRRSRVASWTTVDLAVQYELGGLWGGFWPDEATLQVNVTDLLGQDPPYVASAYGLHYDGVNANPRGRFVSAQLIARW